MTTDDRKRDLIERARIEQSNEVAAIVFYQIKQVWPDLHPVLDLRYGIADALWAAGFRRPASPEPQTELYDARVLEALNAYVNQHGIEDAIAALRAAFAVQGENREEQDNG